VTVTVAMPYWGCPQYVERAVRSVLAQTHRDLRLVVVGDGEEPPLDIDDERLTVYNLPENHGAYFAFQLILEASPDEWHAPHGADDWTEPDHLKRLLALGKDAVAVQTSWYHDARKEADPEGVLNGHGRRGLHVGIFRSERLRAIGGYDPSTRLSQDTHVMRLLDLTGGYHRYYSEQPTYHRWKWAGSLTTAPATDLSSPARLAARAYNWPIFEHCIKLRHPHLIREYRDSLVPAEIRAELDHHVGVLSSRLREAVAA